MVPSKYPKRPLSLLYWCVARKDIYMLYRFFQERFGVNQITILLETRGGHNKTYIDLEEFENDIEVVLGLNDEVQKIVMIHWDIEANRRRCLWLSIEFVFNAARFSVFATDEDGSFKQWTEETYKEMERLFALFKPNERFEEILKRDFLRTYPDRRKNTGRGVVVLDYDGNIKDRIHRELDSPAPINLPEPTRSPWIWLKDRRMVAGVAGSLAVLALLLISFFWS
jgi:hypothetical protein